MTTPETIWRFRGDYEYRCYATVEAAKRDHPELENWTLLWPGTWDATVKVSNGCGGGRITLDEQEIVT